MKSVMIYLRLFLLIISIFHQPVYAAVNCRTIIGGLIVAEEKSSVKTSNLNYGNPQVLELLKETSYEGMLLGLNRAKSGHSDHEIWGSMFTQALSRHTPSYAPVIIAKIRSKSPLNDIEFQHLLESSYREFRVAKHISHQEEPIKGGGSFQEAAWAALRNPKSERDRLWKEVGFIALEEGKIQWPTAFEVAKKLKAYQERTGVPVEDRVGLTHVYSETHGAKFRYHSLADPLPPGLDIVPRDKNFLSTKDFYEMLNQGLMSIVRRTHDLAHAMVWSRHPKVFRAVKELGRKHLENPNNEPLYVRLEWAAEAFSLPNSTGTLLKPSFWTQSRNLPVIDAMARLEKQISQISDEKLMAYAKLELIPRFASRFEPYAASAEQYGEMRNFIDSARQIERFYSDRTPITEGRNSDGRVFSYKPKDILEEQPSNLVHELEWLMSSSMNNGELPVAKIRDLITRMEFTLGMLSNLDPAQTINLMGGTQSERINSVFAEVLRLVRGNHSTLYRAFVD